eukprot:13142-Chlamydomonas_euryale.AAC.1
MLSLTDSVATGAVTVSTIGVAAAAVGAGGKGGANASAAAVPPKASPLAHKVRGSMLRVFCGGATGEIAG